MQRPAIVDSRGYVFWDNNEHTYDTHFIHFGFDLGFGSAIFSISDPMHIFGPGHSGPAGRFCIPLRKDPDFTSRTLRKSWAKAACSQFLLFGFVLVVLTATTRFPAGFAIPLAVVLFVLAMVCGVLGTTIETENRRDKDVRLLLGLHAWGGSDPASWREDFLTGVQHPSLNFKAGSYAELAEQCLQANEWSQAMWAARLCCAVEDRQRGEDLTTAILNNYAVKERLKVVRSDNCERDNQFGPPLHLSLWIQGQPEARIQRVVRY